MTIKKPIKAVESEATFVSDAASFNGNIPEPSAQKASSGVGAMCAVIAGVLALAAAGILTFIIYQHWQFLANA